VHIKAMKYGYARVSTDGQSVEAQGAPSHQGGMQKGVPREGGAKTDRSQLRKALDIAGLRRSADGRASTASTRELLNTLATITARKGGLTFPR
jgi:hypothetical protein